MPDYVVGIEKNINLGNVFYHSEYGVITLKNENWYVDDNLIIKNINE